MTRANEWGQPVGAPVDWRAVEPLAPVRLTGRWVGLEPLAPEHAADLYDAACGADRASYWTYLSDEMPTSPAGCRAYVEQRIANPGLESLAIRPAGRGVEGVASWLRGDPANGSVEVGSIILAPSLQRTTAATEATYLMAKHAFDQGYRRYEWKCDSLNEPSRAAARRLGFGYEGRFHNAVVYKGRNRDTDWFSITAEDWTVLAPAYERWLDRDNHDEHGRQRESLSALTAQALAGRSPNVTM